MAKFKDLSGKKFGSLTVTKSTSIDKFGHFVWKCECKCGKIVFALSSNLINGRHTSCGCGRIKYGLDRNFSQCYLRLLKRAKVANICCDLTFAQSVKLFKSTCTYCGKVDTRKNYYNKKEYKVVGIDRIDNTIGYTKSNCTPCCYKCNMMKSDLTTEKFLEHVKNIVKHQRVK